MEDTYWWDEVVTCKYCGQPTLYGELTWLNGKCMCPICYQKERAKEDAKNETRAEQLDILRQLRCR